MATITEIRETLEQLEPGTPVRLRLADGTDITGVYSGNEDLVTLDDADSELELDQVESVLLDARTEGPE